MYLSGCSILMMAVFGIPAFGNVLYKAMGSIAEKIAQKLMFFFEKKTYAWAVTIRPKMIAHKAGVTSTILAATLLLSLLQSK